MYDLIIILIVWEKKGDFGGVYLVKKVISIGKGLHDELFRRRLS